MRTKIILALILAVSSVQASRPKPHPPVQRHKKMPMPGMQYDNNCMSYRKDTYEGTVKVESEWIEPNWHELSPTAQKRCQVVI